MIHYQPARLFTSAKQRSFAPTIQNTPDLPAIDWSQVGQVAPKLISSSSSTLPAADAIVITWAEAEWAAMQQVFCQSASSMPYADRTTNSWSGWNKYSKGLPSGAPSGWTFWGEWRLVEIGSSTVMLFKSNTHLDFPGQTYLADMIKLLIQDVKPALILSIGTAGGAETGDHVGTVRAVSAGTLYEQGVAPGNWPVYENSWSAVDTVLDNAGFPALLFPVPTTASDLQSLSSQFNQHYGTNYALSDLDPDGLNSGDPSPKINDQTGGATSLLTAPTFLVGTTAGEYQSYACIEMDDAIIGDVCDGAGIAFAFVRNISDPVQSASLPSAIQGDWGSTIYDAYGFYTSYNGALAAWAFLAGSFSSALRRSHRKS
jgi:nucleoside phosphorylase